MAGSTRCANQEQRKRSILCGVFILKNSDFALDTTGLKIRCGCGILIYSAKQGLKVLDASGRFAAHYENTPIQIRWKFYDQKMAIFHIKSSDIFLVSAQNIDLGTR